MWECFSLEFPLPLNALFKTYQNFQPINFPPHLNMLKPAFPHWNLKLISLVLLDVSRDRLVFRAKEGRGSVLPANCHHSMTHQFGEEKKTLQIAEQGHRKWKWTHPIYKIWEKCALKYSSKIVNLLLKKKSKPELLEAEMQKAADAADISVLFFFSWWC